MSAVAALALLLAVLTLGVRIFGVHVFAVLSGSMEPSCPVGSLIYVAPVAPESLQEGDVISFRLSGATVATHRIVRIERDAEGLPLFVTKGDANDCEDAGRVSAQSLIGKLVFLIPKLGYVTELIRKPPGIYAVVAAGAVLLLLSLLPELLGKSEED